MEFATPLAARPDAGWDHVNKRRNVTISDLRTSPAGGLAGFWTRGRDQTIHFINLHNLDGDGSISSLSLHPDVLVLPKGAGEKASIKREAGELIFTATDDREGTFAFCPSREYRSEWGATAGVEPTDKQQLRLAIASFPIASLKAYQEAGLDVSSVEEARSLHDHGITPE